MCSQCVQNAVVEYIVNSVIMSQVDKGDLHNNQIQNVVIHDFTLCFSESWKKTLYSNGDVIYYVSFNRFLMSKVDTLCTYFECAHHGTA